MSPVKIDKRVPIPPRGKSGHPWEKLEVGDSILTGAHSADAARSMAYKAAKKLGHAFEWRKTPRGFRIWRTE